MEVMPDREMKFTFCGLNQAAVLIMFLTSQNTQRAALIVASSTTRLRKVFSCPHCHRTPPRCFSGQ